MRSTMKKWMSVTAAAVLAVTAWGCSSELTDSAAPVELLVTNTQNLSRIDLLGGTRCQENIAEVLVQAIAKNANASGPFVDVRLQRYRVSYVRTDGGTLVPASFTRSIDNLLTVGGGAQGLSGFLAFQQEAFNQAPFVALRTNNGGRDPETGRNVVRMDAILEVFGETLAGDNVYDATRVPIDFCYDCNGCS